MAKTNGKMIANNKKAYHDYFILDTYEAGLALHGTEVKSLRIMARVSRDKDADAADKGCWTSVSTPWPRFTPGYPLVTVTLRDKGGFCLSFFCAYSVHVLSMCNVCVIHEHMCSRAQAS